MASTADGCLVSNDEKGWKCRVPSFDGGDFEDGYFLGCYLITQKTAVFEDEHFRWTQNDWGLGHCGLFKVAVQGFIWKQITNTYSLLELQTLWCIVFQATGELSACEDADRRININCCEEWNRVCSVGKYLFICLQHRGVLKLRKTYTV